MSPRDKRGFLKHEALVNGIKDQFAIIDAAGTKHVVELELGRYGYGVNYSWEEAGVFGTVGSDYSLFGTDLALAQQEFSKQVRALGGRA